MGRGLNSKTNKKVDRRLTEQPERKVIKGSITQALEYLNNNHQDRFNVSVKPGEWHDIVTEADKKIENIIVSNIKKHCPDDSIVAEEGSSREGTSGKTWHIDPIDGTSNYSRGIEDWAICISCSDKEGPLFFYCCFAR